MKRVVDLCGGAYSAAFSASFRHSLVVGFHRFFSVSTSRSINLCTLYLERTGDVKHAQQQGFPAVADTGAAEETIVKETAFTQRSVTTSGNACTPYFSE